MDAFTETTETIDSSVSTDTMPVMIAAHGEKDVALVQLDIRVAVTGLFAETTQTMVFFNPNRQDLEGMLTFPLPDGATVCGYALDVEGIMVDGVVVPQPEARRILEAEERKGVDPGLVEQVKGNLYRTRVYPVPAEGHRTVRITYISRLAVSGDTARYHLPLRHADRIETVRLKVEVSQCPVTPRVGGLVDLRFDHREDRWVTETKLGQGRPAENLVLDLPDLPASFVMVETTADGERFFCVSRKTAGAEAAGEPWRPRRVAVAWDASGSRDHIERDLDLLKRLLASWPEVIVDVFVFRDRPDDAPMTFPTAGDGPVAGMDCLIDYLEALPSDGATNLAALDFAKPPHPDDEAWLLFSDGLGTAGERLPWLGDVPVFTVTAQAENHSECLRHIAQQTGGAFVNLLQTPAETAADMIRRGQGALRVTATKGVRDVHVLTGHDRCGVIGRVTDDAAMVTLTGTGGEDMEISIPSDGETIGWSLARAWAGLEASARSLEVGSDTNAILELARRYGLVVPGAALLMLETLEQYLEYDIMPPVSLPRMRAEFIKRRDHGEKDTRKTQDDHFEQTLALWRKRVKWWLTEFPVEKNPKRKSIHFHEQASFARARGRNETRDFAPAAFAHSDQLEEPAFARRASRNSGVFAERMCDKLSDQPELPRAVIHIQPWSPDTPYLDALKKAAPDKTYEMYLAERRKYHRSPAFFLDCGDYLLSTGEQRLGIRVLSNLMEMELDDPALMRIYAWRLQQAGEFDAAIAVLGRVLVLREDEPQSHRDLALALEARWERGGDRVDAERAMLLLYEVVQREWDRFPEIEIIALTELNRLICKAWKFGIPIPAVIDPRVISPLDLGVRISMSWDADNTDVDLHVIEPSGEEAYYGNNLTRAGGLVSRDFMDGYGPEEYVLRNPTPGTYTIQAHYFGSSRTRIAGPCTVTVNVFTDYGRPEEKKQTLTLRLDDKGKNYTVGRIEIPKPAVEKKKNWERNDTHGAGMDSEFDLPTFLRGRPD